jgi:hypothetical protein
VPTQLKYRGLTDCVSVGGTLSKVDGAGELLFAFCPLLFSSRRIPFYWEIESFASDLDQNEEATTIIFN